MIIKSQVDSRTKEINIFSKDQKLYLFLKYLFTSINLFKLRHLFGPQYLEVIAYENLDEKVLNSIKFILFSDHRKFLTFVKLYYYYHSLD